MVRLKNYNHTIIASYIGNITQAIVNNFLPLLFVCISDTYNISLSKLSILFTCNFGIQFCIDALASKFVDKIGYRKCVVLAHLFSATGLVLLGILPQTLSNPFVGIAISVIIYAMGGGMIEVIISPITEACPTEHKASSMALLHSMYCWGQLLTVVLSTIYFSTIGINNWRWMSMIWALIPFFNMIYFLLVPIKQLPVEEGNEGKLSEFFKDKIVWAMFLLMFCSGAAELTMSQWASTFVEKGLNISKTMGDLLGPCMFALFMGISRIVYAVLSKRFKIEYIIMTSSIICVISYLIAGLAKNPYVSLAGCGLCGFSVGAMWPGCYSMGMERYQKGGASLLALFALFGDFGCMAGPLLIGLFIDSIGISKSLLLAITFPLILSLVLISFLVKKEKKIKNP